MPELPEVEIHARMLREWLQGRAIERLRVQDPRLQDLGAGEVLRGSRLRAVRRMAKYLLAELDCGRTLMIHLGMTGKLVRDQYAAAPLTKHTRLVLEADDGTRVRFEDPRRFGRVRLAPAGPTGALPELSGLGPDALLEPPSADRLLEIAGRSKRPVKVLMMDQALIGGLGNICAAEILYRAGVDPHTPGRSLAPAQAGRIAAEVVPFLEWSIKTQGEAELLYLGEPGAQNLFTVYGRLGQPCPRCGVGISRSRLGGRGTYYCPGCQE